MRRLLIEQTQQLDQLLSDGSLLPETIKTFLDLKALSIPKRCAEHECETMLQSAHLLDRRRSRVHQQGSVSVDPQLIVDVEHAAQRATQSLLILSSVPVQLACGSAVTRPGLAAGVDIAELESGLLQVPPEPDIAQLSQLSNSIGPTHGEGGSDVLQDHLGGDTVEFDVATGREIG